MATGVRKVDQQDLLDGLRGFLKEHYSDWEAIDTKTLAELISEMWTEGEDRHRDTLVFSEDDVAYLDAALEVRNAGPEALTKFLSGGEGG